MLLVTPTPQFDVPVMQTPRRKHDFDRLFSLMDSDNSGSVSLEEFSSVMTSMFHLHKDQIQELYSSMKDEHGNISKDAFLNSFRSIVLNNEKMNRGSHLFSTPETLFRLIDVDGSNSLELSEFIACMKVMGCSENDDELERLFNEADVDKNGSINLEEFTSLQKSSSSVEAMSMKMLSSFLAIDEVRRNLKKNESKIDPRALKVLYYWFKPTISACFELWFGKDPSIDEEITREFKDLVIAARDRQLPSWIDSPFECLALVILLDQLSRNIWRHNIEMYSCDSKALAVVMVALYRGFHKQLTEMEAIFFFLVLTHSEEIEHQNLCVEVWTEYVNHLSPGDPIRKFDSIFIKHQVVIDRFGRFPHRNELLGRKNTEEEEKFLNDLSFRFDLPMAKDGKGFKTTQEFEKKASVRVTKKDH